MAGTIVWALIAQLQGAPNNDACASHYEFSTLRPPAGISCSLELMQQRAKAIVQNRNINSEACYTHGTLSGNWYSYRTQFSQKDAQETCNAQEACLGIFESNPQQWHFVAYGESTFFECCDATCRRKLLLSDDYCAPKVLRKVPCSDDLLSSSSKGTLTMLSPALDSAAKRVDEPRATLNDVFGEGSQTLQPVPEDRPDIYSLVRANKSESLFPSHNKAKHHDSSTEDSEKIYPFAAEDQSDVYGLVKPNKSKDSSMSHEKAGSASIPDATDKRAHHNTSQAELHVSKMHHEVHAHFYRKEKGVGKWGGTCTCPDGKVFEVGDHYDECTTLACEGGKRGECSPSGISAVNAGMKVTCASLHGKDEFYKAKLMSGVPPREEMTTLAEADKAAAAKLAADKAAAENGTADKAAADKGVADKVAADKAVADKAAADKAAVDKAAADADKAAADKAEADKVAADKDEADKIAADKVAADKVAAEKAASDKAAADKESADQAYASLALEKAKDDVAASDKALADKAAAEKAATEKAAADNAIADQQAADKANADKNAADKAAAEKATADKAAADKEAADKANADKAAADQAADEAAAKNATIDQAALDKGAAGKAAADKAAADKAAADKAVAKNVTTDEAANLESQQAPTCAGLVSQGHCYERLNGTCAGIDYQGIAVGSAKECASKCSTIRDCTGFDYGDLCYLKTECPGVNGQLSDIMGYRYVDH